MTERSAFPNGHTAEECILCVALWRVHGDKTYEESLLQWFGKESFASFGHLSLSPPAFPSSLAECYLAFSRSRGEPGPNRKQPPVAHACALKAWREIKGM